MRRRNSRIAPRLATISMSRPMRPSSRRTSSDNGASTVSASSHFEPVLEDYPIGTHMRDSTCLFADHPVPVAVAHVPVRGVRAVHGRDPVPWHIVELNAERRIESLLPLIPIPGRVRDEPRPPELLVHRIVHVAVDPERGLIPPDQPVEVRRERAVERIPFVPGPDRPGAWGMVRDDDDALPGPFPPPRIRPR